ncbi:Slp family lipoprotein [Candidatus Nitrospira neomarina]|uniref:Slp family lipoprotein n=1 Tax=Candidatus Nitrospira neomarina TaxID=3020899 RepID=A0AA96JWD0_9BACT|nr:Slp family lipoprotein [Candidatus Nitrospira neomarina]WNM61965.1 Slp family lipoprotein [Candidatus Nitrospira neomarina]
MTCSSAISLSPVFIPHKLVFLLFLTMLCATGCSTPYKSTLPPDLAEQIDPQLLFPRIKEDPDSFKGKLIILGGQVLAAKRLKDSTQLTILQLPLIDEQEPTTELTQSQGRFIAKQEQFLDPATVPPGTRLTLVGELSGSVQQGLDETIYTYPTLTIKHLKVWPAYSPDFNRYGPYPQPFFYPYAFPYWGGYGRFYPYYPFGYW